MARILVVGHGNPVRTDDGLGWHVAVELFRSNTSPDVKVLPCHQLTPDLAEPMSVSETVIFIDCARDGNPGEVRCTELRSQFGPASFYARPEPLGIARTYGGTFWRVSEGLRANSVWTVLRTGRVAFRRSQRPRS